MLVNQIAKGRKDKKMNQNQKQRKRSRNISIVVAVLIVAALSVTIAALTAARKTKPEPSNTQATQAPTEPTVTPTTPPATEPTPSATQQPTENTPAVKVIEWHLPAAGNLIKDYSADIPVFSLTMEDYRIHTGIDIAGDAGDDVFAAADGEVEDVYYDPMMGQTIVIKHSDSYKTTYQNLQTVIPEGIEKGAKVVGGQKIGAVGDTALIEISENPHLHFCVYVDGKPMNPLSFITVAASASSTWFED